MRDHSQSGIIHDELEMIPEEQRELYSDPWRHLSANAHGPEKVTSSIQNTYFVVIQNWFSRVPNTSTKFPCESLKHGEDKNVIDGLNNKFINILQEDGLICCMNEAKYWSDRKDMKVY